MPYQCLKLEVTSAVQCDILEYTSDSMVQCTYVSSDFVPEVKVCWHCILLLDPVLCNLQPNANAELESNLKWLDTRHTSVVKFILQIPFPVKCESKKAGFIGSPQKSQRAKRHRHAQMDTIMMGEAAKEEATFCADPNIFNQSLHQASLLFTLGKQHPCQPQIEEDRQAMQTESQLQRN